MQTKGGKCCFFVVSFLLLFCTRTEAARYAVVDVNSAFVFETPHPKSKILQELPKDSMISTSNFPIGSYYKVRTSEGTIGWVSAEVLIFKNSEIEKDFDQNTSLDHELNTSTQESDFSSRKADSVVHRAKLRVLGGMNLFSSRDILSSFPFQGGYQIGGEFVFPLYKALSLLTRIEKVYKSAPLSIHSNLDSTHLLTLGSLPAEMGLEIGVVESDRLTFFLAGLGGVALQNQVLVTNLLSQKVNVLTDQGKMNFTGILKANLSCLIYQRMSFFTEMGYRYLKSSTLQGSAGDIAPYVASQPHLDFTGLILDVGVSVHF